MDSRLQKERTPVSQQIIFFDIDGTLLRTGGAGQLAMERALTEEFKVDRAFDGVTTAGRTDRGIANEIFARYDLEDSDDQRERFRQAYLERLPGSLEDSPGLLLPAVRELLDTLAAMDNIVLGLLTGNYAEGAWTKLRHYRLDHYFAFGGFGDHHADRDDVARNAANAAIDHLDYEPDLAAACVVGDTPADIQVCSEPSGHELPQSPLVYSAATSYSLILRTICSMTSPPLTTSPPKSPTARAFALDWVAWRPESGRHLNRRAAHKSVRS